MCLLTLKNKTYFFRPSKYQELNISSSFDNFTLYQTSQFLSSFTTFLYHNPSFYSFSLSTHLFLLPFNNYYLSIFHYSYFKYSFPLSNCCLSYIKYKGSISKIPCLIAFLYITFQTATSKVARAPISSGFVAHPCKNT